MCGHLTAYNNTYAAMSTVNSLFLGFSGYTNALKEIGFYVLHKINTMFTAFRLTMWGLFVILYKILFKEECLTWTKVIMILMRTNSIEFLFIYLKAWTMYSEHRPCLLLLL